MGKIDLEFKACGQKLKLSFSEDVNPLKIKEILSCLNNSKSEDTEPKKKKQAKVKSEDFDSLTIIEKLRLLFEKLSKIGWFTSQHVKELYFHEFGEQLKSSTVSTYLSRLHESEELSRRGSRTKREYLVGEIKEEVIIPIQA